MASLPPLPKPLRSVGAKPEEGQRRTDEWARSGQDLLRGLREMMPSVESRLTALENAPPVDSGVTDHGALMGLGDDDHTQYLLADGSRALGGDWSAGTHKITNLAAPTNANDAARLTDIPVAGTTAGTYAEGNDSRLSDDRTASGLRTASTVVAVSSATAPAAGDILVATDSNAARWESPSATALPIEVWEPRAKPSSAHADDNEFDSSIADFTDWDHGAYLTNTLDTTSKRLVIDGTGNATTRLGGMYKAVPAGGEYSIVSQVAMESESASSLTVGIMLLQGTGSTDDVRVAYIQNQGLTTIPTVGGATFAAYNGAASALSAVSAPCSWIRLRVNGTTVATDWSVEGITWLQISSVTIGFTPTHMGVFTNVQVATAGRGFFYCFRVKSGAGSSAFDANRPGRLVRVGV